MCLNGRPREELKLASSMRGGMTVALEVSYFFGVRKDSSFEVGRGSMRPVERCSQHIGFE